MRDLTVITPYFYSSMRKTVKVGTSYLINQEATNFTYCIAEAIHESLQKDVAKANFQC